jgi:hypothetical protein
MRVSCAIEEPYYVDEEGSAEAARPLDAFEGGREDLFIGVWLMASDEPECERLIGAALSLSPGEATPFGRVQPRSYFRVMMTLTSKPRITTIKSRSRPCANMVFLLT